MSEAEQWISPKKVSRKPKPEGKQYDLYDLPDELLNELMLRAPLSFLNVFYVSKRLSILYKNVLGKHIRMGSKDNISTYNVSKYYISIPDSISIRPQIKCHAYVRSHPVVINVSEVDFGDDDKRWYVTNSGIEDVDNGSFFDFAGACGTNINSMSLNYSSNVISSISEHISKEDKEEYLFVKGTYVVRNGTAIYSEEVNCYAVISKPKWRLKIKKTKNSRGRHGKNKDILYSFEN